MHEVSCDIQIIAKPSNKFRNKRKLLWLRYFLLEGGNALIICCHTRHAVYLVKFYNFLMKENTESDRVA